MNRVDAIVKKHLDYLEALPNYRKPVRRRKKIRHMTTITHERTGVYHGFNQFNGIHEARLSLIYQPRCRAE